MMKMWKLMKYTEDKRIIMSTTRHKADYNTNVTDTNEMYGGDKDDEDCVD